MTSAISGSGNTSASSRVDATEEDPEAVLNYIPTHLLSDYIKIGFYTVTFLIGTVVNAVAFIRLLRGYCTQLKSGKKDVKTAFIFLKLNLVVSNLTILFAYNLTHVGWLVSYSWLGGDVMCRLCHTLFVVAYQSCSNITAAIALDRFRNVRRLIAMKETGRIAVNNSLCFVKCLVIWSWLLAGFLALPQNLLWKTVEVARDWHQCVSVWDGFRSDALNAIQPPSELTEARYNAIFDTKFPSETVYTLFHMLTVFWIPFILATATYTIMIIMLRRLSKRRNQHPTSLLTADATISLTTNNAIGILSSQPPQRSDNTVVMTEEKYATGAPSNGLKNRPYCSSMKNVLTKTELQIPPPCRRGKPLVLSTAAVCHPPHNDSSTVINQPWESQAKGRRRYDRRHVGQSNRNGGSTGRGIFLTISRRQERKLQNSSQAYNSHQRQHVSVTNNDNSDITTASDDFPRAGNDPRKASFVSSLRRHRLRRHNKNNKEQRPIWRRRRSWRSQMQQKALRTTGLIITLYSGCWLPYNVISILLLFRPDSHWSPHVAENLDWLKGIMVLNAVINPFLYGFKQDK